MPNSLLLTLLATNDEAQTPLPLNDLVNDIYADPKLRTKLSIPSDSADQIAENLCEVVDNIKPVDTGGQPSLIKDVAQQELYEALYSIIQKEYGEPPEEPLTAQQDPDADLNSILNGAIGMAL